MSNNHVQVRSEIPSQSFEPSARWRTRRNAHGWGGTESARGKNAQLSGKQITETKQAWAHAQHVMRKNSMKCHKGGNVACKWLKIQLDSVQTILVTSHGLKSNLRRTASQPKWAETNFQVNLFICWRRFFLLLNHHHQHNFQHLESQQSSIDII